MKKNSKTKRTVSAESVARLADSGKNVSSYFTNRGKMMPPLESVGLDLQEDMIEELNAAAKKLKLTRQALIKRFIRHGLDQHHLTQKVRKAG
jgi:hypothetical protein